MGKYLIVGGGFSGLLVASHLLKKGVSVEGLEKSDSLGGRIMAEDQRFYSGETARLLEAAFQTSEVGFSHETDGAKEVRKGELVDLKAADVDVPLSFYLQTPFFALSSVFRTRLEELVGQASDTFRLRKTVAKVKTTEQVVVCSDGEEISYDRLVWCSPLKQLIKALSESNAIKVKLPEPKSETSGFVLELESREEWFTNRNTVCLPFRYKEHKLMALGTSREAGLTRWLLFLEEGLFDDREEIAKCVRTLKRELTKAFPIAMGALVRERVVFWPMISGEPVAAVKSIELVPGVGYVGPQARLPHVDTDIRDLDLILRNFEAFEQLAAEWQNEDISSSRDAFSENQATELSL